MPIVQFAIPMPKRKTKQMKQMKQRKEKKEKDIKAEINTLPSALLTLSPTSPSYPSQFGAGFRRSRLCASSIAVSGELRLGVGPAHNGQASGVNHGNEAKDTQSNIRVSPKLVSCDCLEVEQGL